MRQWQTRGWFSNLMTPLSWVIGAVVARKQAAYLNNQRKAHHPGVPVIIVGNILVGGTGKTPVVIAITRHLQSQGWRPGILSRGYGVQAGSTPRVGDHDLDAENFGDEPVLINRQTGAPIAVHPLRVRAATALLQSFPDVDVLVCDDGLQHLALARDVEIVVQDQRGIGNGRLLPAGPLREPAIRLQHVAAVITNRSNDTLQSPSQRSGKTPPAAASPGDPIHVDMHVVPEETRELIGSARRSLGQWAEQSLHTRICAAAGIGQPEAFFNMLQRAGIVLVRQISLPDHYDYQASPFVDVDADVILVTAKDGVKCQRLGDPRIWEVPITATFDHLDFPGCILDALNSPRTQTQAHDGGNLL